MIRSRRARPWVIAVALGALAATLLPGMPATAQETADTIRIITVEPTQGLDPAIGAADASRGPMSLMYDNLVDYDENGQLVGGLAESWTSSEDLLSWTFALRAGTMFSDGSPITAEDVKWSIDRMRESEIMAGLLSNVSEVTIADPSTIEITLSAPSRALPQSLSRLGSAAILSQAAVEGNPDYFALPTVTSGPYMLETYTPRDRMVFQANPNYWREGYPKTPTLEYIFSEDQNSWAAAIESGSADLANVGYADAQRLRQGGQIPVEQSDLLTPLFWGWNTDIAPFDNKSVRQAVAYAVDRQGRIDACWFGTGAVTYGNILRPWDPNYVEINTYDDSDRAASLAKAGELLESAGWVLGSDGMRTAQGVEGVEDGSRFTVEVPYEGNWPAAECNTLLLQSTLNEIGIEIQPRSYDPAPFWGDVADDKFVMYHGGAGATNSDDLYLNWFRTGGALTPLTTHLEDPEIDAKIDAAVAAPDAETAKQIYSELEHWQADELPMLVVGYQWGQIALAPGLEGYYSRPDGGIRWITNATLTQ
jgi:peptide/nickel transport system substrate-binding protein